MYLKTLRSINPWWDLEKWQDKDKHILDFRKNRIRWIPNWIHEVSLEPFSLNFVIGPRQVGKTTGIKLLIEKILKKIKDSEDVFYINCDIFPDFESLRETLTEFLEEKEEKKTYIFLDEVTSVNEWWKAIKYLIDAGITRNSIITVTGSSSLKLKKEAELFPGRRGKGKDTIVLPLSFKQYVEVMKQNNIKKNLKDLFKHYISTGGFALTINSFSELDVLSSFINEFNRAKLNLEIAKETLSSLISKMPSALSYHAIASETSGYSYKTIQQYLEIFRELFIIDFAYLKKKRVEYRKEKKIFFIDPLLLKIFADWTNTEYLTSALMENIVQAHLFRKYGEIYYYRNKYEIDCIANGLKIEVKAGKPYRKYPKTVKVVNENNIAEFLLKL